MNSSDLLRPLGRLVWLLAVVSVLTAAQASAQQPPERSRENAAPAPAPDDSVIRPGPGGELPTGYFIGTDDVLSIVFWGDPSMSAEVVVRPDGHITVPLLNDVRATGRTPEELRKIITAAADRFIEDPEVTVLVKEIHSRKVYITGNIGRPGAYPLTGSMNVMQLIALAGGLAEYADRKNIVIIRTAGGGDPEYLRFNYNDVIRQRNVHQNVLLQPGDTVVVR